MGEFTWSHLLTVIGLAWGALACIGGLVAKWLNDRLKTKLDREEYVRGHSEVISRDWCQRQHEKTAGTIEKVSEEFAEIAGQVRELLTNQRWVMDALKTMHQGVKVANPHPEPLPPDPRDMED